MPCASSLYAPGQIQASMALTRNNAVRGRPSPQRAHQPPINAGLRGGSRVSRRQLRPMCAVADDGTVANVSSASQPAERPFMYDFGFGSPGLVVKPPAKLAVNPKAQVMRLIEQGSTNYRPSRDMAQAVHSLITSTPTAPPVKQARSIGKGTWEVFFAPHIVELSRTLLGTRFEPITYTFQEDTIVSHVKYRGPVVGTGWLSASGTYQSLDDSAAVRIAFDKFWLDVGEDSLRTEFYEEPVKPSNFFSWTKGIYDRALVDRVIGTLGRAAFFPDLSVFPVSYLDDDVAVFSFEPMETVIAVRHVSK